MTLRQVYIISILLITPLLSTAQDSTAVTKGSKLGFALYLDYAKFAEVLITEQEKWEFGLGVILRNKVAFVGEYGYANLKPASVINNGTYVSEGNYYRAGIEYMFNVAPKRYLALGAMYASSRFNDQGTIEITSELWPSIEQKFIREALVANWIEVILNTEAPIFRMEEGLFSNFYWGARLRVRVMLSDLDQPDFDIFAVPGFGKTYSPVVPAFNLFLKYRIDF
jgi:hypothetical protein